MAILLDPERLLQGLDLLACQSPHHPMLADIHRQSLVFQVLGCIRQFGAEVIPHIRD